MGETKEGASSQWFQWARFRPCRLVGLAPPKWFYEATCCAPTQEDKEREDGEV